MTLKSLALRTKKSLSGLYTLGSVDENAASPPETPKKAASSPITTLSTPEGASPKLQELVNGLSPSSTSSDSPSRRVLRRSLRKMRSSFEVLRGKPAEEALSHVVRTPPSKPRPSLALNFEVSPPDQPIFSPERYSCNSSRADIHHSSPITVPGSKRSTPLSPLPTNTVPDSPAPLTKVSVQDAIASPRHQADVPLSPDSPFTPVPTPMPGTDLSMDDIQLDPPEIVVSSPTMPTLTANDYFAIPVPHQEAPNQHPDCGNPGGSALVTNATEHTMATMGPEASDSARVDSLLNTTSASAGDPYVLEDEARKSLERKADSASAYLGYHIGTGPPGAPAERSKKLVRRRSAWGRHTGLYDGTGYAFTGGIEEDDDKPATSGPAARSTEEHVVGEPGPIVDVKDSHGIPVFPVPAERVVEDHDNKEALHDIIRAYSVYQDTGAVSESGTKTNCDASEKPTSETSTAETLVG